jgi:hypothetical protein
VGHCDEPSDESAAHTFPVWVCVCVCMCGRDRVIESR